jgi:hypothetical protein
VLFGVQAQITPGNTYNCKHDVLINHCSSIIWVLRAYQCETFSATERSECDEPFDRYVIVSCQHGWGMCLSPGKSRVGEMAPGMAAYYRAVEGMCLVLGRSRAVGKAPGMAAQCIPDMCPGLRRNRVAVGVFQVGAYRQMRGMQVTIQRSKR